MPPPMVLDRSPPCCRLPGLLRYGVLDLSKPYQAAFNTPSPTSLRSETPFHGVWLANDKLDE